ncbi:50S ribosomal protein L18 [Candidatus Gastranaerophilus sp. (ex Termes propinquus)]|nr:50S ribosomal protein L18 [Candidatus Gastranaerophilus sp. (ex Termes propinquus)]
MIKTADRKEATRKRHQRVRLKISGTSECPRLAVYRSIKHIYAQIIDDTKGVTLASSSTKAKDLASKIKNGGNIEAAALIGKDLAEKALKAGVKQVVFDRGGFLFHGRVKALAEAAREGGLEF